MRWIGQNLTAAAALLLITSAASGQSGLSGDKNSALPVFKTVPAPRASEPRAQTVPVPVPKSTSISEISEPPPRQATAVKNLMEPGDPVLQADIPPRFDAPDDPTSSGDGLLRAVPDEKVDNVTSDDSVEETTLAASSDPAALENGITNDSSLPGTAASIVAYRIINGREIVDSLTGAPGDPDRGRTLYFDLEVTGCSGCHGSPGGPGAQSTPTQIPSPRLDGVGARLSVGEIRLWLVAPSALRPDTEMPGYYEAGQRLGAHDPLYGGPRLSAQQIEDLVSYLNQQNLPN